jgi:hypothetical protein
MRSTGIGWGLGWGRAGAIVGPMIGTHQAVVDLGTSATFLVFAIPAAIAAVAMLVMHRILKPGATGLALGR